MQYEHQEAEMTTRRHFLSKSAVAFAGGLVPPLSCGPTCAASQSAVSDDFVLKSQSLPQADVILPTDRLPPPLGKKKRIAAVTTAYFKSSHADDIITKFIEGYAVVGRIHLPHCEIVSLYVDQFSESDIARGMAARYGIPVMKTPAEALTLGGKELGVDGVLLIGEHGDYPTNEKGQKLYPRRRRFEEVVKVFRQSGRSAPVFNDKHLSYSWDNAEWMYQQAQELEFPMMAGSSVPVTWRIPPLSFRPGIPLDSAIVAGYGGFESYGFHCLEFLQTFVERRQGGETGVKAVQALEDAAALRAAQSGDWPAKLLPAAIAPVLKQQRQPFNLQDLRRPAVSGRVRSVLLLGQKRSYHGWRFVSLRC
jgi:hypothetical protein